jgi:hypothetical protein
MRGVWVGLGLTLLAGMAAFFLHLSPTVAATAVIFGLLATKLQFLAGRYAAQVPKEAAFSAFVKGWGMGMGLRFLGVVVLAVVCTAWPEQFPAIGAAIGYLGVLIPLLFLETRTTS